MVTPMRWLTGVVMVAACVPGPLDEVGARCSTERPCSAPLFCAAGVCSLTPAPDAGRLDAGGVDAGGDGGVDAGADGGVDAGADGGVDAGADAGTDAGTDAGEPDAGDDGGFPVNVNLVRNPGFELGVAFWAANGGTLAGVRQALAGNLAGRMTKSGAANPTLASSVIAGETTFGMLFCARAWVRHFDETFAINLIIRERFADGGVNASNGGGGRIDAGAWVPISESLVTFGNGNGVDLRINTGTMPPDASVLVDEVWLIRATGTNCP